MTSPISSWENVEAYFTGYGSISATLVLVASVLFCFGALYMGHRHECEAYDTMDEQS